MTSEKETTLSQKVASMFVKFYKKSVFKSCVSLLFIVATGEYRETYSKLSLESSN